MLTRIADTLIDLSDIDYVTIQPALWDDKPHGVFVMTRDKNEIALLRSSDRSECEKLLNEIQRLMNVGRFDDPSDFPVPVNPEF